MDIDSVRINSGGHTRVQWAVAILVNLIVFSYGLQCGWISPMTKVLQSAQSPAGRPLTDSEISLVAGMTSLTAMAGIPLLLFVVETFGRKLALSIMSFFQLMCWITKICSATPTSLLAARVFCGLGAGGCFIVVPMYIKEISQDNIRGTLGSIFVLFQNLGILAMYALGAYLDYYTVLYIVIALPVLTVTAILFTAPESPSVLVKKGKLKEAANAIALLRGLEVTNKEVNAEVNSIKREDDYFRSIPNISFFNIFKEPAWRRGFIIMTLIILIHGCNGAFAIINYAATLLANSDVKISPELQTLAIPVFLTIGTSITMCCIDSLGRKILLGVTFTISAITFIGLGSLMLFRDSGWAVPGWLPIVAILVTVCCYGAGVNPIPFIISSELFNFQIRGKLMAILSFLAWFMNFVQLVSFTAITNSSGVHVSFYTFGLLNLLGAAMVVILLPETKGKSVEQIEAELRKEKKINNDTNNYSI